MKGPGDVKGTGMVQNPLSLDGFNRSSFGVRISGLVIESLPGN